MRRLLLFNEWKISADQLAYCSVFSIKPEVFFRAASYVAQGFVVLSIATSAGAKEPMPLFPRQFKAWVLPEVVPYPEGNQPNSARIALGKMLFFDPRVSGDGSTSCASCHSPMFGWSDGLPVGRGFQGQQLNRASPSIVNAAYNKLQMWDGRKKSLEDQAMGPLEAASEMNTDLAQFFALINSIAGYRTAFAAAYPHEAIDDLTFRKAIASFERTVISRDSPFDRWVAGKSQVMTAQQLRGLQLFTGKANCVACHSAPNFTDDGFHNIGLASFAKDVPDMGRYGQKPVAAMKGAFKTPSLRDIERSAPYFHDGSAKTLREVLAHYNRGGDVSSNLSANIKPLNLTDVEIDELLAFLKALSSPLKPVAFPSLPQ